MTISNVLSKINIDRVLLQYIQQLSTKVKNVNISQQMNYKFIYRIRNKLFRIPSPLIVACLLFCLCSFLFYRSTLNSTHRINSKSFSTLWSNDEVEQWIDFVRDISLIDQNVLFNVSHQIIINDVPKWISEYNLMHFFNFLWLQNGAYRWHSQQLMNFRDHLVNRTISPAQRIYSNDLRSSEKIYEFIQNKPQNGILLDTSVDPISALFAPLPRTSTSLKQFCQENLPFENYSPCSTRPEKLSQQSHFQLLITYALYNVILISCDNCPISSTNHYNELIFIVNVEPMNSMQIVQQILPRLIRLLALVPPTSFILLPHYQPGSLINEYLTIFIERGLISTKERFIRLNSSIAYHSHVLYSTSTPRSDIVLLQHVLLTDKLPLRRELILVLENRFDSTSYNGIIQTINQFELPSDYEYLHLHEYKGTKSNLKQISELFRQSMIIIGMSSDLLSNLVWCFPGTHLIEVAEKPMKNETYQISVQLKLNYWLVRQTRHNRVDIDDFRNLMLKVLTNIDN